MDTEHLFDMLESIYPEVIMKTNKRKLLLFVLAAALIAAIIIFRAATVISSAEKKTAEEPVKRYISYEIQSGDTLWSIAEQYCREYGISKTSYIEDVKKINHLESNRIRSGSHLIVIRFETAVK